MSTNNLFAITDSKMRVVVIDERSGLGYSYPRILKEENGKYLTIDVTLLSASSDKDRGAFEESFNRATPKTLAEIAEYLGLNLEALTQLANEPLLGQEEGGKA